MGGLKGGWRELAKLVPPRAEGRDPARSSQGSNAKKGGGLHGSPCPFSLAHALPPFPAHPSRLDSASLGSAAGQVRNRASPRPLQRCPRESSSSCWSRPL